MKLRSSTKIFIGFAALLGGGYFAYQAITYQMIMTTNFQPIKPGNVNIVGLDAGAGYRIVVANQIAQLVQSSGGFGSSETSEGGATEGAIKKRLPIKELLQTLQGNTEALGKLIMSLNDIREDDTWPTIRVVWRAEDLKKAIAGDPKLHAKLVSDLNIELDGKPLATLRPSSLENGIMVDSPVAVKVNVSGKLVSMVGRVQEPYKPRLMKAIEKALSDKNVTNTMMMGYYAEYAEKDFKSASQRENVANTLLDIISDKKARERAEAPERVLRNANVVVNESFISKAGYETYDTNDGKKAFNLNVELNDEGRKRLWKFSKTRVGSQLLLVANGVAIAAPKIQHELAQGDLTITQMHDEVLVRDAVDMINDKSDSKTAMR